ncbi:TolC family protein, partial [Pseudomonas aeruginosa]
YNRGRSWSDVTQATTGGDFKEDRDYDSYVSTLCLQQPLFDYEAFSRYRKGVAQALLSDERFRSQSQELLVRVLEAYTGALLAQDHIELARAQKRSDREHLKPNQRQLERGNGTRTDTLEPQARFNLAQ